MPEANFVLRVAVALVLVIAGVQNGRAPAAFATSIEHIGVPRRIASLVAHVVIIVELVAGAALFISLLVPSWAGSTGVITSALAVSFVAYTAVAMARGIREPCYCLGVPRVISLSVTS